jgi:hypothetical protein
MNNPKSYYILILSVYFKYIFSINFLNTTIFRTKCKHKFFNKNSKVIKMFLTSYVDFLIGKA